jgi:hypothetical protein
MDGNQSLRMIDHKRRGLFKKKLQHGANIGIEVRFFHCLGHQRQPSVARRLIDLEWIMPHPQARMPALLNLPDRRKNHP